MSLEMSLSPSELASESPSNSRGFPENQRFPEGKINRLVKYYRVNVILKCISVVL